MKRIPVLMGAILAAAGLLVLSTNADAQTATSGSSGKMWGTSATGTGTAGLESSAMHNQDGSSAGQVNAAKSGLLLNGGPGMSITAIGSQNIVSTTVIGDNNTTNVNTTQTSSNSGNVSNNGTIVMNKP